MSWRRDFDAARDPYTARNALGITSLGGGGGGFITAVSPPLQVTGTTLSIDLSAYLTTATAAATYQPLDADLTAIAALAGTNVIYYRSAANTWTAVTIGTGLSFTSGTLASTVTAGAPVGAEYITSTSDATLTSERVLTDTATVTWDRATAGQIKANAVTGSSTDVIPQCGRLEYVSSTALSFKPYNGDRIKINGTIYAIPAAGIAGLGNSGVFVNGVAAQNLVAGTAYWVFAFINSGVVTADFRTAATHAPSATAGNIGVEILTGNDTRTLIGFISAGTGTPGIFINNAANRLVISWFNRTNISFVGAAISGVTTSSTSLVELTSTGRVNLVTWSNEAVCIGMVGMALNNSTTSATKCNIGIDSTTVGSLPVTYQSFIGTANVQFPVSPFVYVTLGEVLHTLVTLGCVDNGTGTFYLGLTGMIRG